MQKKINIKKIKKLTKNLESGFFGFWVKNLKTSFLLIFLIIVAWLFSLFTIPKESSPDVKFWIISISISYPGVNPVDMDSLITEKIENEIEDLEWIKKISSTSAVWMSSVVVELETGIITRDVLTDIKDKIDNLDFPDDASDPFVTEIGSNNELIYEALIYWDANIFDDFSLNKKAKIIKNKLEWTNGIAEIEIWWLDSLKWTSAWWWDTDYTINVLLDKNKVEQLGLSIINISNIIKINNKDTPIWNFNVWNLGYDFRFEWQLLNVTDLKNVVLRDNWVSKVILSDIADFELEYPWDDIRRLGWYEMKWKNYISIVVNKSTWASVFDSSRDSKQALEELLRTDPDFRWLSLMYSKDMSELIIQDYDNLSRTATTTIILVFITIMFFVWFREWIIASLLIPLSFLITFTVLDLLWLSLNFLTNFSLVLTLWIAIDTVIVIIEWASEKMKLWFSRRRAITIAIRDFKSPLISWTLTTLAAFLPLMFLPGLVWKFLSYIPITVFSTLLAALILSLTLSTTLFLLFMKSKKTYHKDKKFEKNMTSDDVLLLEANREGKKKRKYNTLSIREKALHGLWEFYEKFLNKILHSTKQKILFIFIPVLLLITSLFVLSPRIWFILFPNTDMWIITIDIVWQSWVWEDLMSKYLSNVDNSLNKIEEVKTYYSTVKGNRFSVYLDLTDVNLRKDNWQRSVYEVEKIISNDLENLRSEWLDVSVVTLKDWPPTWSPVWVKLKSNSALKFDTLKKVADDFEIELRNIAHTKNITSSSSDSPGQFVFTFDKQKLSLVWLNQNDILAELYFYTNWIKAWSIKSELEDNEIQIFFKQFEENLSPSDIENIVINTRIWKVRVWDFATFEFKKSVNAITRENGDIIISVWSEVEKWFLPTDVQPTLDDFAKNYNYPDGISFLKSWEWEENKELIVWTIKALIISIFLIFSILVFQFNSFLQPLIVLYSIVLAFLWVNIWLYLTGNPYSMPFGIWFIALTWVVVNDAIILIDKINKTISYKKWHTKSRIDYVNQIIIAWKSRLQPIIVTTLTTIFWILPLAVQDEFWAWLGFTIIFWLFMWSTMTIVVIPILYDVLVIKKKWI